MEKQPSQQTKGVLKKGLFILLGLLGVFYVCYLVKPWFHWLAFNMFYQVTGFWVFVVVAIVITIGVGVITKTRTNGDRLENRGWTATIAVLSAIGLLSYWVTAPSHSKVLLAQQTKVQTIKSLPETTGLRYQPLEVARNCAENRLNDSTYKLGDLDPIEFDGQFAWVAPLEPNGVINTFKENTHGVVIIRPGENANCSLTYVSKDFKYGEGMQLTDNLKRQLWHRHYNTEIPETFYVIDKGQPVAVAPYITWKLNGAWMVRTPSWGGVFIAHPDGKIEDLSPEKAQKDPRLVGQRIFPEALVKKIAGAQAYRLGTWNAWAGHKDQPDVPTVDDSDNQMPYLIPTKSGPQWFVAFEPHGKSFGLKEIMLVDAHTGQISQYTPPKDTSLIGVNKAAQRVRNALPQVQWQNFVAYEPRPVVHDKTLYWMITVTNNDHAGVTFTALVNAQTSEVRTFCSLRELNEFLADKNEGSLSVCTATATQTGNAQQPAQPQPAPNTDLKKLSDKQLAELLQQIGQELQRRHPN